jgi:hypothetical protein
LITVGKRGREEEEWKNGRMEEWRDQGIKGRSEEGNMKGNDESKVR